MELEAEAEKMAALKRAYADVILNTAKESAARIMASERRALRFQHSLSAAKDEALATMLRLKALMDAQIKEAETTSLNQAKRIQELEAQLNEAECSISSLRKELERANDQLAISAKTNLSEPSDVDGISSTINATITVSSKMMNTCDDSAFTGGNVAQAESPRHVPVPVPVEEDCGISPELAASIIMRTKEPELYRNGCTQRIRAFDHSVVIGKVHKERIGGQTHDSESEPNAPEIDKKLQQPQTADSAKTGKSVTWGNTTPETKVSSCGERSADQFARRFSPRKPRTRCIYVKPTDCLSSHKQDTRHNHLSQVECSETKTSAVTTMKSIMGEPPQKLLKSHSAPISNACSEDLQDKETSLNVSSRDKNSVLVPCNSKSVTKQILVKQNELNSKNEISQCFLDSRGIVDHESAADNLTLLCTTAMKDDIFSNGTMQNDKANHLEYVDSKLPPGGQNMRETSNVLDIKDGAAPVCSKSIVEATCEAREALPRVEKDKFLKYTFQRTRKRGSSSKTECVFSNKIITTVNSGDNQNFPGLLNPTSVPELPRNNRLIMQVTRQEPSFLSSASLGLST